MNTFARWTLGAGMGSALMLSTALSASAAELVVIETSANAGVAAGDIITNGQSVTIPAGETATLIGADGTPVTLTGPFNGVPQAAASAGGEDMSVLASLLGGDNKSTASLGVIRAGTAGATADVPAPYLVNVTVNGNRCLPSDGSITLYRSDASASQPLVLGQVVGGNAVTRSKPVPWKQGRTEMPLPKAMTKHFKSGSVWEVTLGKKATRLTFHTMPATLTNATQQAVWMAKQDCKPQAIALINNLR